MNPDENKQPVVSAEEEASIALEQGKPDPLDAITDVEELRKQAKATRSIAQRYKGKLKDAKAPAAPAPANPNPTLPTPPKDEDVTARIGKLETSEKKRSFGHAHQLSPTETDTLFGYAQGRGIAPEEALNDPFFQAGLKETRRAERVNSNIPSSSNRSGKIEGKTFEEMDEKERSKNWGAIVASKRKK